MEKEVLLGKYLSMMAMVNNYLTISLPAFEHGHIV